MSCFFSSPSFSSFPPCGSQSGAAARPFLILNIGGAFGLVGSFEDPVCAPIRDRILLHGDHRDILLPSNCRRSLEAHGDDQKRIHRRRHAWRDTGIIGYFGFFGMGEAWAPLWRAQGTFKDPNVSAPSSFRPSSFSPRICCSAKPAIRSWRAARSC